MQHTRLRAEVFLAGVLALSVWAFHLSLIGIGDLTHYDEFYTLNRAASFSIHGDWLTVYSNGEPNFKKPPLQYWMSALLLESGVERVVALRLPSMLFALGSLAACGFLAWAIAPPARWAIPGAVLILAGSTAFWENATSALLDAGATFFVTASLGAAVMALRRPGWWMVVALLIGLGALQKAPVPLILVGLFVLMLHYSQNRTGYDSDAMRADPRFRRALRLAIFLSFAWPVFQLVLYGPEVLQESINSQMTGRFVPFAGDTPGRGLSELWALIIGGEWVVRGLGILALLILPWATGRRELWPLAGIMVVFILAMCFASGNVYPRYSLLLEPLQAAAIAVVLTRLLPRVWLLVPAMIAVSAVSLGPIKPQAALNLIPNAQAETTISVLGQTGTQLAADEVFVLCMFTRERILFPGAAAYYTGGARPVISSRSPERLLRDLGRTGHTGPLRGVCDPADLERISSRLAGLEQIERLSGYVYWRADGLIPGGEN